MDVVAHRVAQRFNRRLAFERVVLAFGLKDLAQLSKKGRSFGVMSAYRSNLGNHANQERHGKLVAELQTLGYRNVTSFKSQWEDMATNVVKKEKSLFIPRIPFKLLCQLSKKYEQDALLYKHPSDTIGIYDKHGMATLAFDAKGSMAVQQSLERAKEYSRGRSVSFGLTLIDDRKFPYGGYDSGSPVTMGDVVRALEDRPLA